MRDPAVDPMASFCMAHTTDFLKTEPLVLCGCEEAAKQTGVTAQTLRSRLARQDPTALQPVGLLINPPRWIFSQSTVTAYLALHGYGFRNKSGPRRKPVPPPAP